MNNIAPYINDGIPELDLPSVENYTVKTIPLENIRGNFEISGSYDDVLFRGISNYTVTEARGYLDVSILPHA